MRFPHKERERHTHHKVVAHSPLSNVMKNSNNAGIPVGFRFHPTDEELVGFYLYGRITSPPPESLEEDLRIIRELDLYRHEPWDLSEVCKIPGDHSENQNNWYFFSHKDKKYPTGNRANRATKAGFWKATGRDKCIQTLGAVGMRKTLVFYRGRAPHGQKTDWIMHEFRLEGDGNLQMLSTSASAGVSSSYYHEGAGAWVVCRVFRKTKNVKSKGDYNDTPSTSVEEDPQMALLPEITDSTEKFSSDEGEHVDYNPAQHLQQYCKQELLLSLNDYSMLQYQGNMLPPEGNREQTNGTSSLFRTSSRSTTITTPNNNTFLDPQTNGTSSLFRTSSRSTTITTPNNHTYLDPTSTALFEHHTMAKMGSCCAHPSSSSAPGFFPPLANNCNHYQAVLEETLPREHIRGLVYRSTPAMLDGLEEIRFGNSVLLQDQSLTSVVTRPQERLFQLQEHLSSAPNHPTVPFGMTNNYMGASLQ